MLLWLIFAVLTAVVVMVLLRPLARNDAAAGDSAPAAADIAVYRDQLREVDADAARGLIDGPDAEAARLEVSRRLLASAARGEPGRPVAALAATPTVFSAAALGIVAVSLALYLVFGSPGLPSRPSSLAGPTARPPAEATVAELVAQVEQRLRDKPQDGTGWDVIAPVYLKLGRYRDAADAFERAGRLLGETSKRLSGFAEATIRESDGIVTEPARKAYERLLALEPQHPEPRFWLAVAKEQDGRLAEAVAEFRALLAEAPASAAWREPLQQRLAALEARLGGKPAPDAGPTADDMAAMARLAPAERQARIEQMVEGLAQRLKSGSTDVSEWLRLVRAYSVLGRREAALGALADARRNLAGDASAQSALSSLARSLGLES